MTLYEISESVLEAVNNLQIDEETGEVINIEQLDAVQAEFNEKAENVACYIKNRLSDITALKAEEKALAERRKSIEKETERLKKYLKESMQTVGKDKVSTARADISFRKSTSVNVDDEFLTWAMDNHDEYLKYDDPKVNKTALKQAIQDGADIPYARIQTNLNLQIK